LAAPWGEVTAADVAELETQGVFVRVFAVDEKKLAEIDLSAAVWHDIAPYAARSRHAAVSVISTGEPIELDFDAIEPPKHPASAVQIQIENIEKEIDAVNAKLNRLTGGLEKLAEREAALKDALAFSRALAAGKREADLFALNGWCPAENVARVRAELTPKMALLVYDPTEDDDVPVELKNGKTVSLFEPLVKMFELPKYGDWDPCVFIAPFMTLFFALALGDAAYGLLLLLGATYGKRKLKPSGDTAKALGMLQFFGGVTLVVGLLTGTFMGVQIPKLGPFGLPGVMGHGLLWVLTAEPAQFFYLSLILGVVQMMFGMGIRLVREIKLQRYQNAIATLGFMMIAPGVAVWVWKGFWYLFVAAMAMLILFNSPYEGMAKRIGGGLWAVYDKVIGLFGDIMSYVRVFGLGLASGIIGLVVNKMAAVTAGGTPVIGWLGGAVIFLFGHSFNFAMAVIGAIVHPARLQFLEFYGTYFEGGGRPYEPLKQQKTK
jgi:V/A-type H+-transporting ATPase subunit I